jgi:hypothetical protein
MDKRERMIKTYVEGYNIFDVSKMITDFYKNIVFENIQNGEVSMTLKGIDAFILNRDWF